MLYLLTYFPGDRDQIGAGGQGGGVLSGVHPAEDGEGRGVQGEDGRAETRARRRARQVPSRAVGFVIRRVDSCCGMYIRTIGRFTFLLGTICCHTFLL